MPRKSLTFDDPSGSVVRIVISSEQRSPCHCPWVLHPAVQFPAEPLKSETSRTAIPIPQSLALMLSAHVAEQGADTVLSNEWGHQLTPWTLERHFRQARARVATLPEGFRYHDLRHYFASLLIASGTDVKVVQARLRHLGQNDARHVRASLAGL